MTEDELLVPAEVSEMLRTPVKTLAYWRAEGRGPAHIPIGRRVLYRRSTVLAWVAEQEAGAAAARRGR
jgi:predicted DNA-binding transcriptional regulator AlpA